MGIYDKKKSISRRELRETFRKHSGRIPGTGGRKYYQRQRERIAGGAFGSKYGSQISKDEYRRALRDLGATKRSAKTRRERLEIDKKIRYIREMGGKKI